MPADPRGEDAVEEGLDQSGAEEMLAFFGDEFHAKRLFQSGSDGLKGGEFLLPFDPKQGIARIRCEKPCHIFWLAERGGVEAGALDKFDEWPAFGGRHRAGMGDGLPPEILFSGGERESFHCFGRALRIAGDDQK